MLVALLLGGAPLLPVHAQDTGSLSGLVLDAATLQPLVAVRVHIPGTAVEVLTDRQGEYRLEVVPAGLVELRVERLGYAPVVRELEIRPGEHLTEDFALDPAAIQLDELLITATGVQRRRELGNAAAVIRASDEVERALPTSVVGLLQGRASGVQVLQASGTVGGSGTVKVRGNSSIGLGNTPLIYVDGARVSNSMSSGPGVGGQTTSRLNDLSPDEIETIEIVRGPSAATLYGTEAAAGVIRVTTKRGRTGAGEWTVRSEFGGSWDSTPWPATFWHPRSILGEEVDLAELFTPGALPPGVYVVPVPDTLYRMNILREGRAGEDVYGTPWRTGGEQTHGISLRGGTTEFTYFLSGEFSERQGTLPNNRSERRNARANFNFTPSPRVDVAVSTSFASTQARMPDNDNNAFGYLGVAMLGSTWNMPIRRADLSTGGEVITCPLAFEYHRALRAGDVSFRLVDLHDLCAENPFFAERTFADVRTLKNHEDIERFVGSTTLDYRPLDFVTARATLGYDQYSSQVGAFVPVDPNLPFDDSSRGFRSIGNSVIRNLTLDADVNARFQITPGLHSTTSLGVQFFRTQGESASSVGRILPTGTETVSNAVRTEGFESVAENRTIGYYIQQQLGLRDRLFVTPAVRFDQNSAFGRNLGWEVYPRIMASYVVSEEPWFPRELPLDLASLRLRGAWGQSGKQPSATAALQLLSAQRVTFRGVDVPGVRVTRPGNPDLAPERGQEVELGLEADLLGGRLGVDVTVYHQVTRDAIVGRDLAPSTGFPGSFPTNIGEIRNRGVELALDALVVNRPRLRWDWQLHLGTVRGEITRLEDPIPFGLDGVSQRHQEGRPFASYWSRTYEVVGGELVVSDTAQFVGHPTPEWEGSISTSATVRGWVTLHANLGFAGGHQQFNAGEHFRCAFLGGGEYGGVCPGLFEMDGNGNRTDEARRRAAAAEDGQYHPWIEDASFARVRVVSARFELPERWLGRVGVSRGSFTLSGENLALFTRYSGLDPEINFAGGSQASRAEFLTLPPAKRVTGRLSLTF